MDVYTMARTGNAHVTLSSETKPWNRLFT